MTLLAIGLLIFVPMLVEAARAPRNERAQKARGGIEPPDDVYAIMRIAYPAAFLAMLAEGAAHGRERRQRIVVTGLAIFAAAKIIKWSAILALGPILDVPRDRRARRHARRRAGRTAISGIPTTSASIGELVGAALMTRALVTGPIAVIAFAVLLHNRIAVEERVLRELE